MPFYRDLSNWEASDAGGKSLEDCKSKAEHAGVTHFAWTGDVYGGYCKIPPEGSDAVLSMTTSYNYHVWEFTCTGSKMQCCS